MCKYYFEKFYPPFFATTLALLYCYYFEQTKGLLDSKKMVEISIGVFSIFIGFVLTAKSILLSIQKDNYMKIFKTTGRAKELSIYLQKPLLYGFFAVIIAFVILGVKFSIDSQYEKFFLLAWTWFSVNSLLSAFRISRIFGEILLGQSSS